MEKEAAVKDSEFVLGVISEYQKRIQRLPEECNEVSRLTVVSKIDNDVSIISKVHSLLYLSLTTFLTFLIQALGLLSAAAPAGAPSTPSKSKPLTGGQDDTDVLESKLFMMAKKLIEIKAVIERTESPKRTTIMAKIIASIKSVCPLLFPFTFNLFLFILIVLIVSNVG